MDPLKIINKYYEPGTKIYYHLIEHSKLVAKKALEIAKKVKHLNPDLKFIEEAAMLHDVGIFLTKAPLIGCVGNEPYIRHGYLGRKILEKEGHKKHALVCERHIGVGLTKEDIIKNKIPLPKRDVLPISIEEKIICFADKFFSKYTEELFEEKSIEEIKKKIGSYGPENLKRFEELMNLFDYQ